ncbi:holo-ACP synthase [Ruania suaedae]|uniref:holo-ACP synthase n=1 Tax=Ruania suaedae TaxID=2897774 RepID=UPI001E4525E9|nr:holo-ACP synthase [Ruania suaedae]UFU02393.1 holo-ACP synthase [Ruania suaedae]
MHGPDLMTVLGIGTDLVAVARFDRLIERGGRRFLERWFAEDEVEYCLARSAPAPHAAARFAAKEAVFKSLRIPGAGPPRWREIEVTRTAAGLPGVRVHGSIRDLAEQAGVVTVHLSLSHDRTYATATAVALTMAAAATVTPPRRDDQ